jgi:fibronectin-binding autotransporter adhesin
MKQKYQLGMLALLLAMITPGAFAQTVFFSDRFTNSTLNSASPGNPTTTNTAYEMVSSKTWTPTPTMTANDFKMGIPATTAGYYEAEALFATNQVALTQPGDFIELTVVFTNTSGLLTVAGQLGFGLYNSGQVKPIAGGINNTLGNTYSGGAQNWQGYVGAINFTGASSRINTRPTQTATTGLNQDLVSFGTSSSYAGATGVGTATGNLTLTVGATYTELLVIQLNGANSLAITNTLYAGVGTGGIVLTNFGGIATNGTFLTSGFDGLAIGYTGRANTGGAPTIDISSVKVDGSVTVITGPPTIVTQPVPTTVATGGACAFSVSAIGFDVTYQWARNGTNLLNAGNISGAKSSQLIVSSASAADVASGANGYYCIVTGAGPFSTNTVTNALALVTAKNLTWTAAGGATWDLNNTISWQDQSSNPQTFNYGDIVRFDDTASTKSVTLSGNFLSPSSMTVDSESGLTYSFTGSGSIAGTGNLLYTGTGQLTLNAANTYSGGTLISNTITPAASYMLLQNYNGLGTGPVVLDNAGGTIETSVSGSATVGINGNINVLDDFNIKVDGVGTFATVLLGELSGTTGKTLTINPAAAGTTNRFRAYGTNTVFNANLVLDNVDSSVPQALYNGTVLAPYGGSGSQMYNGVISGVGGIVQRGNCTTILANSQNTYSGGTFTTAGTIGLGADCVGSVGAVSSGPIGTGPLFIAPEVNGTTGNGMVLAYGSARSLLNPLQYPSGTNSQTLNVGGSNDLTFAAPFNLAGQDGVTSASFTARTILVTNTGATIFAAAISDSSSFYSFVKAGAGTLYLNAANTFTGTTTNTAGVLAGNGSLAGSVVVTTNASIGGGTATTMGTLTVSGNLTLTNGGGFFRVNRSGLASDNVSVGGALTNTGPVGTITVDNVGATLQVGDTFTLFNKAMSNGAALTVIGGNVAWGNNLAVNGTIVVVTPPDMGIQLSSPASVLLGANITNTVTVTNIGPGTALGLVITDTVPANVTFVSANSGGTTNGHLGVVVWNLPSLAPNTSTNFTLVFNATTVGNVTNVATVASSSIDTNPSNNSATNITAVTSVIIPGVPPRISTFSLVGANVVINGTNGVTGGTYYLLGTTNITKPIGQWTPLATNVVTTNGLSNNGFSFTGTNVVIPGAGQQYYILSSTNN